MLGRTVLEVSTEGDSAAASDVTAGAMPPMGRVGFSTWEPPTLPALEVE